MNHDHIRAIFQSSSAFPLVTAGYEGKLLLTDHHIATFFPAEGFQTVPEDSHAPLSKLWKKYEDIHWGPVKPGGVFYCDIEPLTYYRQIRRALINEAFYQALQSKDVTWHVAPNYNPFDSSVVPPVQVRSAEDCRLIALVMGVKHYAASCTRAGTRHIPLGEVFRNFACEENGFYLQEKPEPTNQSKETQ